MLKHRRAVAWVFALFLLFSAFVSSACIAHEAAHGHACTGDRCPICRFIAEIEQLNRGFGLLLLALLLTGFILAVQRQSRAGEDIAPTAVCTLVSRKIRLND